MLRCMIYFFPARKSESKASLDTGEIRITRFALLVQGNGEVIKTTVRFVVGVIPPSDKRDYNKPL